MLKYKKFLAEHQYPTLSKSKKLDALMKRIDKGRY